MSESRIDRPLVCASSAAVRLARFLAALSAVSLAGCRAVQPQPKAPAELAAPTVEPGVELTGGAAWEYRAVTGGRKSPWTASLRGAVAAFGRPARRVDWPRRWVTFSPWEHGGRGGRSDDPASFARVPAGITLHGVSACRATLGVDERGILDLAAGHGEPRLGRWAYAFAAMETAEEQDIVVRARADGPMTWWADGKCVFQAPPAASTGPAAAEGAPVHCFRLRLAKGSHVLAVRVASGEANWDLVSSASLAADAARPPRLVEARCAFDAPAPGPFVSLTFVGPDAERIRLNGRPLPLPLPRLHYEHVVGVPPSMLEAGRNVLSKSWTAAEVYRVVEAVAKSRSAAPAPTRTALLGLRAQDVEIHTGPLITRATETSLTIVCRTNAAVPVVLQIDGRRLTSPPGLIHRVSTAGLRPATAYPYTLSPACEGASAAAAKRATARTPPAAGPVTIGLVGDGRTSPQTWGLIARAVHAAGPDLVVYGGDLVGDGLREAAWDRELFGPAAELLANVPLYAVIGNHERRSPVFDRIYTDSLGGRNWSQQVADVLLVGIDGGQDWSPDEAAARWLDRTLAASEAAFVFVISHYPAYSSSTHGRLTDDGRMNEACARTARELIYPILQKHRATALVGGHDHCYERSEPPGGVTSITTAGAGAGLYGKRDDPKQNPYSKVFAKQHHYCLLRTAGRTCTLTAVDLSGRTLDRRTWKARPRGQAGQPSSSP